MTAAKPFPMKPEVMASALDKVGEDFPSVAASLAQWVIA